ncbi:hypothetical protein GGR56DRAFT_512248 [Xylariaceae sp. FL0804]|nr:hypothetical protein GGR56DRAFT_512248 [Xylariaceae sp. FL0804]
MEILATGLPHKSKPRKRADRMYGASPNAQSHHTNMNTIKRPLRTYGTRTASADSTEPRTKRRRILDASHTGATVAEDSLAPECRAVIAPGATEGPSASPALPPQPSQRGRITAYFKKIAPSTSSSTAVPSDSPSAAGERASTPPSSPPPLSTRRRKARRLTTRVASRDAEKDADGEPDEGSSKENEYPAIATKRSASRDNEEDPLLSSKTRTSTSTRTRTHLVDLSQEQAETRSQDQGRQSTRRPATVQTTLSLSVNDSGYTECKDCGMLYNPFHSKDVKYHARRHAALRRAKSRNDNT